MHLYIVLFLSYMIVITITAYILNIAIIVFAITSKRESLRDYRRLLIWMALSDLICTTLNSVTMAFAEVRRGNVIFVSLILPHSLAAISAESWSFSNSILISNVTLLFVYRYTVVCASRHINGRRLCVVYAALAACSALSSFTYFLDCEGGDDHRFRDMLAENEQFRDEQYAFYACSNAHGHGLPSVTTSQFVRSSLLVVQI